MMLGKMSPRVRPIGMMDDCKPENNFRTSNTWADAALLPASPPGGVVRWFGGRAHIALLATLTAYFLVWPIWRIPFPIEIAWNEGWNAYFADAAGGNGTLYPSPDTLIVNNYPPLSFYAFGWAEKLFGDALYIGRVVSILATLGIGALIARIVLRLGGGATAAAVGGVWFVAIMARSFNRFVGMNDPQLAGQFLMVAALAWFLARDQARRTVMPPILLMVVAGFWKHNIIAIPATTLVWLVLRDGRRALPTVAGAAAAGIFGLVACVAVFGEVFLSNLLTPRAYHLVRAFNQLGHLQWLLPALVLWMIWAWSERHTERARFSALFVGAAFAEFVVQSIGEAVLDNAQFDLVIAVAIGIGLAYERAGKTWFGARHGTEAARTVIVLILALRLILTLRLEPFLLLTDPSYRAEFFRHAAIARTEAARVAAIPGPVACDFKIICRMAGKPFVYDDFRAEMLIATGAAPGRDEHDLIAEHGLAEANEDPAVGIESLYREFRVIFNDPPPQ